MAGILPVSRRTGAGALLVEISVDSDGIFERPQEAAQRLQRALSSFFIAGPHYGKIEHSLAWIGQYSRDKEQFIRDGRSITREKGQHFSRLTHRIFKMP